MPELHELEGADPSVLESDGIAIIHGQEIKYKELGAPFDEECFNPDITNVELTGETAR